MLYPKLRVESRPSSLTGFRALPAVLLALLVVGLYADPLLTRRSFVGRDIVPYNLPLEKAVHDAWARGRLPVWWSEISGGRPLLPNPNAGVFYPLRPLLSRLSFPAAMRLFPVLHWILAGWGMLALARASGRSQAAAWVAAVSFAFSGVMVSEVFYTNFQPGAALLPWSLWALVRPSVRPIGRALPVALIYGAMLCAGDAFSLTLALLSAALWLLCETPPAERVRVAGPYALGLAAAAFLALPQILATVLLAPETRRVVGGVALGEALNFTISPWRLFELIVPYPFGPTWAMDLSLDWGTHAFRHFFTTFFLGPVALVGLFGGRGLPLRGARFVRWLVLLTAALALIGHAVPAAWARLASPIPLRYPEKFMLGATFGLAMAAGIAVDRWLSRGTPRFAILAVSGALALCALGACLAPEEAGRFAVRAVGAPPAFAQMAGRDLPGALAEAGLCWVATALAATLLSTAGLSARAGALVLLTAIPVAANRRVAQTAHEGTVFAPTSLARTLARRDPKGSFRALDESPYRPPSSLLDVSQRGDRAGSEYYRQSWFYYSPALWRRGLVLNDDLDAGDLSRVESLRRVGSIAAAQRDSAAFFASLALRFGVRFRDQEPVAGYRRFGGDAFRSWDENPAALADIRLVSRWREATGPLEALSALARLSTDEIVIETGRHAEGAAAAGTVELLERTPERLVVATRCEEAAWLFVLRGDWSYRTVEIDGRPAAVFPAQIAFAAVRVPAGDHRIEWRENAPGLDVSGWGPLISALLLAAGGLVWKTA